MTVTQLLGRECVSGVGDQIPAKKRSNELLKYLKY